MITADYSGTASPRGAQGIYKNGRIDFESAVRIGRDVSRRQDVVDPVALPQQQPANLLRRLGSSQR